ncbi:DUF3578 domain-containing protein [Shewanella sp. 10N.286.51.B2]|uniref:MrcB family domain-containing protein n=1 Tax=Shewanella sp. 10N.286.51.B2 TaxID=3229707 RepID=UPI003553D6FB
MSIKLLLSEIADGWVAAKGERFTNHPIANQLRNGLKEAVRNKVSEKYNHYLIKSSAGAGNWADVPWLAIMNPEITETTQSGIYPVYLFRADGTGIYLSVGFGTTNLRKEYGAAASAKAD